MDPAKVVVVFKGERVEWYRILETSTHAYMYAVGFDEGLNAYGGDDAEGVDAIWLPDLLVWARGRPSHDYYQVRLKLALSHLELSGWKMTDG